MARGLSTRAMWHLGEGRVEQAWQDILAIHRLARLIGQQRTLVEQLVAVAIDGMASNSTKTVLNENKLTAAHTRTVLQDLSALSYFKSIPDSIDTVERAMMLDIVLRVKAGRTATKEMGGDMLDLIIDLSSVPGRSGRTFINDIRVAAPQVSDWDAVLARCNEFYDRLSAAARIPPGAARKAAAAQIDAELNQADPRQPNSTTGRQLRGFASLSPEQQSSVFASAMIGLLAPAILTTITVQDRANTTLDMTRLAAALAVLRAARGQYPDKLDDLVPSVIANLPMDAFNTKTFLYKRDGDGYLLYSTGENGTDDGGSNSVMGVFEGRSAEDVPAREAEALRSRIPKSADDWSIRLPRPPLESPFTSPGGRR